MKITTTGSLGNVASLLVKKLIGAGHEVTVITTKADKTEQIEALGASAAVGSISDAAFLTEAFNGADAVFTMVPPSMGTTNIIGNIADAGKAYAEAIRATGIERVVLLSSVGADATHGTGPVQGVHRIESSFGELTGVNITVVRSGFFYYNFLRDIPLIKSSNTFGTNYNGEDQLLLTHPEDLAAAIAKELEAKGNGFEVKYVVSDIATGNEVASAFGPAIGKPELTWSAVPDEILQQGLTAAGLPEELIGLVVELGQGVRSGVISQDFFAAGAQATGQIKLKDFTEEFKGRYKQA